MKRLMLSVVFMMLSAVPVLAQRDCGDGLPCGRLPWDLPVLPALSSPTPMPTVAVTVQPTPGPGTPTVAPSPTIPPISTIDTSDISDQVATLGAVMAQTPYIVQDFEGTPVDTSEQLDTMTDNAELFFGYARSIGSTTVGKLSPLLSLILVAIVTIVGVKATTYLLPFIGAVFGIIQRVINLILDFLPL